MRLSQITDPSRIDEGLVDETDLRFAKLVDEIQKWQDLRWSGKQITDHDRAVMRAVSEFHKAIADRNADVSETGIKIAWLSPKNIIKYAFGDEDDDMVERRKTKFVYAAVDEVPLLGKFQHVYFQRELDFSTTDKVERFRSSVQREADKTAEKLKRAARWKAFLNETPDTLKKLAKSLTEFDVVESHNDTGHVRIRMVGHTKNEPAKTVEVVVSASPRNLGTIIQGRALHDGEPFYDKSGAPDSSKLTFGSEAAKILDEVTRGAIAVHDQIPNIGNHEV